MNDEELVSLSYLLLDSTNKYPDFQNLTGILCRLTGAKYGVFNLYSDNSQKAKTVALYGSSKLINKAASFLGYTLKDREWDITVLRLHELKEGFPVRYDSLADLVGDAIPRFMCNTLEKTFNVGTYYVFQVAAKDNIIGDFILFFEKNKEFTNTTTATTFTNMIGLAIVQKQASDARVKSEANFKAMIENSLESVWSINSTYEIQYVNEVFTKSFQEAFGVTLKPGMNILEALPGSQRNLWKSRYDRVFKGEHIIFHDKIDLDQASVYVHVSMNPITIEGKVVGASVYGRDITASKMAEEQLINTKQTYQDIYNALTEAIYILDDTYTFIDVNKGAEKMYGYTREELIGQNPGTVAAPGMNNLEEIIGRMAEVPATGKAVRFDFWAVRKNGEIFPKDVIVSKGRYFGRDVLIATARDMTYMKKAEADLLKSEADLKAIIENSLESIWSVNTRYEIEYVNEVFARAFQLTFGVALEKGTQIIESLPENLRPLWKERLDRAFNNEHFVFSDKIPSDASDIYIEVSMNPIQVDGKVVGASFFGKDITDKMIAEKKLIEAKNKAEESNRLKTAFLANMSHEIRTPMNGIIGFMQLLQEMNLTKEKRDTYFDVVKKSGQRLLDTINDIIEMSKIESGHIDINLTEVSIEEIMKFHYQFFKPRMEEKNLEFICYENIKGDAAFILTDKVKLDGILTNLINNALKFTAKGRVEFGNYIEDSTLHFYVSDTGIGIPEQRLEAIFERFVQADIQITRPHEGSGLGLSISRAYAEILGGKLSVTSEVGKGTTFRFTIPYQPLYSGASLKEEHMSKVAHIRQGVTILVAEDDETSYMYLENILQDAGVSLIRAISGTEAVQAVRENPSIALVLMDIRMPEMNGLEATRQIRKLRPTLPIIAQTAYALSRDRDNALEAGCTDYISKPIDTKLLLNKVEALLQH